MLTNICYNASGSDAKNSDGTSDKVDCLPMASSNDWDAVDLKETFGK